jgi:hypothetical protein
MEVSGGFTDLCLIAGERDPDIHWAADMVCPIAGLDAVGRTETSTPTGDGLVTLLTELSSTDNYYGEILL